ncbi:coatomer subunit gamma [Mycoemilia scoparia]|uniref:Coatomer subunit gamma n=1 Tax=Mycoemilia scoparia TaxID=417184 RepID=A0A9W8DS13_9FUNG|nr:coatomer subunit gamma [Mycoemilia scoparia]
MDFKKDDDSDGLGALLKMDNSVLIQEARLFNETPIKPRQCRILLAKILYLLNRESNLSQRDATELFFGITKLFQNKDMSLRQMVYLAIKELSNISSDVIMATSSLMKDMQPKSDVIYRGDAIRALCKITDASMIPGIERFLKAAIVDRDSSTASAALVSSYHLYSSVKDTVRRWNNEIGEALSGKAISSNSSFFTSSSRTIVIPSSNIVQYHAAGLMYLIRQQDRMAVLKLVQNYSGSNKSGWLGSAGSSLKNNMALCMLVRYAVRVMEDDPNLVPQLHDLLKMWVAHRSDMVSLEAARAICNLKKANASQISIAVNALQKFLSSPKPTVRFAAIRTLNSLAVAYPEAVQPCNVDIEDLITDSNRSVATLAITTLLKTGNEASVDRLMEQIQEFMSEISDEFKIIVVEAVRSLGIQFPQKHAIFLNFLARILRDEGGYDLKQSVVSAIMDLSKHVPSCQEAALAHLCEFIEDCEFTKLSVRILHLLGEQGPDTPQPTIYIRHIYNRVILENAAVRAAAVNALAKFCASQKIDESLYSSIRVLLERCLDDRDDEVRDRAAWALSITNNKQARQTYIQDDSTFSLAALERKLVEYCADPEAIKTSAFSFDGVPRISRAEEKAQSQKQRNVISEVLSKPSQPSLGLKKKTSSNFGDTSPEAIGGFGPSQSEQQKELYAKQLSSIPEIAKLGAAPLFSSEPASLTEAGTEYDVACVKHVYESHIVYQFKCVNTISEQVLENVEIVMQSEEELDGQLDYELTIPVKKLVNDEPGYVYVVYSRPDQDIYPTTSFDCTLKFLVKECDPETYEPLEDDEGYEDEYSLEPTDLTEADYMQPSYIANAQNLWESFGTNGEAVETLSLTDFDTLEECVAKVVELLGMYPLEGALKTKNARAHQAIMTGAWMGKDQVIARARMTKQVKEIILELTIRSKDQDLSQQVLGAIA